ncbi:MAG: hypothetical protein R3E32_22690 [Chitinophagales bacterium]
MKRNCIVFFVLCLFAFTSVFGQRQIMEGVNVSWGDVNKGFTEGKSFIAKEGNKVYLLNKGYAFKGINLGVVGVGRNESVYYVEIYDKQGNFQSSKEIQSKVGRAEVFVESVLIFNERLLIFTSQTLKGESTLYVQEMDKESLELIGEKRELIRTELPRGYFKSGYLNILSPNEKKIAILNIKPFKDKDKSEMDILVFDENMEIIWSKTLNYEGHSSVLDNDGNLYRLAYSENDSNHWSVRKYSSKGENIQKYELGMKNFSAYKIAVKLSESNDIICGGFYAEREDETVEGKKSKVLEHSFIGTFHTIIDKNLDSEIPIQVNFNPFDTDFLSKFSTKKSADKSERLAFYKLREMIVKEDNSIFLVSEQSYNTVRDFTNPDMTKQSGLRSETNTYYSGSIILAKINSVGKMEWVKKLDKFKSTSQAGGHVMYHYLGHVSMIQGNELYFVFNDYDKKKEKKVKIFKVSENGEVEKRTIHTQKSKEGKYPLWTNLLVKVSGNEYWIHTRWMNKSKIGVISFD